jgi:hypothetical protein
MPGDVLIRLRSAGPVLHAMYLISVMDTSFVKDVVSSKHCVLCSLTLSVWVSM